MEIIKKRRKREQSKNEIGNNKNTLIRNKEKGISMKHAIQTTRLQWDTLKIRFALLQQV